MSARRAPVVPVLLFLSRRVELFPEQPYQKLVRFRSEFPFRYRRFGQRLRASQWAGVVISLYYYFGVIRTIYWSKDVSDLSAIPLSLPIKAALATCIAGMLFIGIYPNPLVNLAGEAVKVLR